MENKPHEKYYKEVTEKELKKGIKQIDTILVWRSLLGYPALICSVAKDFEIGLSRMKHKQKTGLVRFGEELSNSSMR